MQFLSHKKNALLFLLLVFVLTLYGCNSNLKYEQWKDSYKIFGDGEYQLLQYKDSKGIKKLDLRNMDRNCTILVNVQSYEIDGNQVVLHGKCPAYEHQMVDMIVILNTKDNSVKMIFKEKIISAETSKALERYLSFYMSNKPILLELNTQP